MELHQLSGSSSEIYHCPFNKSHTMPYKTLAVHLTKCPDRPLNHTSCFFNALHVLPDAKIKEHEKVCPNRYAIDRMLYQSEDDAVRPIVQLTQQPSVVNDESWDEPQEKINVIESIGQTSHSMKSKPGLTKSERKKHRAQLHVIGQNVDMSYNGNLTMRERQIDSTGRTTNRGNQEQTLFFGRRPNA